MQSNGYAGPDRRRHRMYVTRNTEYHFRDGVCVAVRNRRDNRWDEGHVALNRTLSGAVRFNRNGDAYPALCQPRIGEALFFATDGPDVVTSVLTSIERPDKNVVGVYPM